MLDMADILASFLPVNALGDMGLRRVTELAEAHASRPAQMRAPTPTRTRESWGVIRASYNGRPWVFSEALQTYGTRFLIRIVKWMS